MTKHPQFQKIFEGVATRQQMFDLLNQRPEGSEEERIQGTLYPGAGSRSPMTITNPCSRFCLRFS